MSPSTIVVVVGLTAAFAAQVMPQRYRGYAYWMGIIVCMPMALSRLVIGVHWASDLIGGALLGVECKNRDSTRVTFTHTHTLIQEHTHTLIYSHTRSLARMHARISACMLEIVGVCIHACTLL